MPSWTGSRRRNGSRLTDQTFSSIGLSMNQSVDTQHNPRAALGKVEVPEFLVRMLGLLAQFNIRWRASYANAWEFSETVEGP